VEYRMLHKNGQWRTLHSRESIFSRDAEGNPMEILGVAEDITERKSTEEALRQGELRYHVLFTAAKRQALELSLLDQVKTAISREMDLSTIFRVVVEAVAQAFGYRLVSLYLRKGDMLHVQHQVGYDRIIEEIPIERGISGRVVRTGQPVLLEDVQRDPDFLEALPGILSEVCVPLFDQGHAVGVLNIESEGARLGEADLRILSLLAEDLNLAISKARLLAESRANEARQRVRAEELQALYETSLEINSQRDIANLLQAIVRRAVDLVGTKMGGLYLAREDGLSLELVVSYGFLGELVGTRLSAGEGLSGKILQTGQSMMVADYQAWEGQAEVYRNLAFRRVLGVPMKVGDRVIGVINLTDDSATGLFSEEEVRLVSMFADQAAIAVENERLITELKGELAERSRAELALSQSEERYRTLVQSQEEGVAEVDPDEVFRFANPSAERILGVEPGNLVGRSLREFTSPEEFDAAVLRTDARRQGKPEHYEQWIVRPSGEQRLLRLTALPRFDKDGQYMGVFGVFEDITEKRQAEEERERLASFAELNPAPILEVTVEGKVQYWNRVASERFPDLQTRGARHPFLFGLSSVSAFMSDHGLNFMVRQVRVDGAIFQQGIYTVENGRLLRIYGLDVTEQKQAEEGLRISEQRYRLLVEHNLAGVFRSTPDGRLLDCNDSFAHILGYETREEVLAQPAAQFYDNPEERAILISRLLKEGYLSNFEFKIRRRDDKLAWVLENATVIIGEAEMPIILQGTVIDISDRKDAQRELEESLQRLRQTLSETVQALASVGEMKDPYTAGHQLHVSQLASAIAREMGFDENQVEGVRVGGLVHDLGKLYVPAEILSKPGKLSPLEMSMIQTHAQASYEILKSIQFPWPIAQMALQHHERMNGSGYPHHLHGPEILVEARILAVADVVEAMANHRPYRPAHGVPKALEEVQHGQGELFDAQVVDACLRLFREKGFQFQ
jgi:PAS domain S-box-containing protein/putative nucleotidyltransferase with HDIG domain